MIICFLLWLVQCMYVSMWLFGTSNIAFWPKLELIVPGWFYKIHQQMSEMRFNISSATGSVSGASQVSILVLAAKPQGNSNQVGQGWSSPGVLCVSRTSGIPQQTWNLWELLCACKGKCNIDGNLSGWINPRTSLTFTEQVVANKSWFSIRWDPMIIYKGSVGLHL